jgi:hypothetical protein
MADQDLRANLKKKAENWARQITRLANQYLGDKTKIIKVKSSVEEQGDKIGTKTVATGAAANAYEYGSGIRSRRSRKSPKQLGSKGYILIKPVNRKVLAFPWQIANDNPEQFIFGRDGDVLLPSVKHPGVKAVNNNKGYISPAINEVNKKYVRRDIVSETEKAILGTLRKSLKKK